MIDERVPIDQCTPEESWLGCGVRVNFLDLWTQFGLAELTPVGWGVRVGNGKVRTLYGTGSWEGDDDEVTRRKKLGDLLAELNLGNGKVFDPNKVLTLKLGAFYLHPPPGMKYKVIK